MFDAPVTISRDIGAGLAGLPRFDSRTRDAVVARMLSESHIRQDSQSTAAFARQLEHIFKEIYQVEFPELRATEFIPLSTEVPPGALTHTYRMWNKMGQARIIHNYAADAPNADVEAKEWPAPVITLGASYNFSVVDIQRAALTNVPIESLKAEAARWAIEYLLEQVAALGSSADGVVGLTNAPGITAVTQASTGTWLAQINAVAAATAAAPATAVAAAQGIIADINKMKSTIFTNTIGIHQPTDMLVTPDIYAALDSMPRSPAFTDDSLLTYIEKICRLKVNYWPQLVGAGATGTLKGRVMVYKKDPKILQLVQAQPFTQLPPQPDNYAWKVPCMAQTGGVVVRYPLAVAYMDGLNG